jgi:hypothetical protein
LKTIEVRLDPKSIENAIKELEAYKKEVEQKARLLVQRLTDYGAEIARIKIVELDAVDTGGLLSGVNGYYDPATMMGYVKVTSDHAAFIEFGTGVVGMAAPHPNAEYLSKASWGYATGQKIFTTKDGVTGWIYPNDNGEFVFTTGNESRPFMYQTALILRSVFPMMAMGVFNS